jgi:hypothetical protein
MKNEIGRIRYQVYVRHNQFPATEALRWVDFLAHCKQLKEVSLYVKGPWIQEYWFLNTFGLSRIRSELRGLNSSNFTCD